MAIQENEDPPESDSQSDEAILKLARKRFDLAAEAETEGRAARLEDSEFRIGKQWPDDIRNAREQDNRPCLVINKLPQFANQITNDQRQNRPSIKVNPVDDEATIETAKVFQGLIRHIETNSNADIAYDRGFESTVNTGLGYLRVVTDYCDANSFDQEIFIKSILDTNSVYLDPHFTEPDGSDADWGFVFIDMARDEFKSQFPGAKLSQMEDWVSVGEGLKGWVTEESARIAEYFYVINKKVAIALLSNGKVIEKSLYNEAEFSPLGIAIVKERETLKRTIKWCKINGVEVLDKKDWAGQWIPIIPILGSEFVVDGKRVLEGIIRHAKDPQRMYNYWATAETETMALAPKAPWIGVEGQFEGHEEKWRTANNKNHAFLEYKATTIAGQPAPPPTRNAVEPPIQAISAARAQSSDDLKATTGIYDPSLGNNRAMERSGVAIQRLNTQAQVSNYHFIDNLSRSLRHCGRILIDLIPKIYDTPRIGRMIGEDGSAEMVKLNQQFQQGAEMVMHDLSAGKYDVTVTTGPSYTTKRQEAVESMLSLTKNMPQTAPIISDLLVRQMDWPMAQECADRLKKTLPPGIAEDDKDNKTPLPPQVQAQMNQQGQMIQMLTQHLDAATEEIRTKKFELDSKERIAMRRIQADCEIALAQMKADHADTLLEHQVGAIQHSIDTSLEISGQEQAALTQNQQPTGGPPPGSPMGG